MRNTMFWGKQERESLKFWTLALSFGALSQGVWVNWNLMDSCRAFSSTPFLRKIGNKVKKISNYATRYP